MAKEQPQTVRQCCCKECGSRGNRDTKAYHKSINRVLFDFDERSRRLFAGLLARQLGRGGIQRVFEITGLSRMTIRRGLRECAESQPAELNRIRRAGGGRKLIEKKFRQSKLS